MQSSPLDPGMPAGANGSGATAVALPARLARGVAPLVGSSRPVDVATVRSVPARRPGRLVMVAGRRR